MASYNSLDKVNLIAALLHDVNTNHVAVFNARALRLTVGRLRKRYVTEGVSFFTKTLPRLGKAFDKALSCDTPLNSAELRLSKMKPGSKLPKLFGELFEKVLHSDGTVLPDPCTISVGAIRQLCYLFYKYELPYNEKDENKVIAQFEKTEQDLETISHYLSNAVEILDRTNVAPTKTDSSVISHYHIVRSARARLDWLLYHYDPMEIQPRHGPGAVSTKETLWNKYRWTNVSKRLTDIYPFDEYFCSSLGSVCDRYKQYAYTESDSPARVILVPKDSRGPRLISCEPVDFQWIQQGIMRSLVPHVEAHPLTKDCVFFTNQQPNQFAALYGSETGKYATLDLKEASDRVCCELVKLLFPTRISKVLMATRSLSTVLPDGREITMRKFAPMGSALCFPIMALTIWSLLDAGAPDKDTRESIHVYGDDVIVPTAFAETAICILESFGLKVNRDKSCTKGFFRESCGVDAFKGINVTPLKLRTVWTDSPSPESYSSWVAYANDLYDRKYYSAYDYIVGLLSRNYGPIADDSMINSPIRLRDVPPRVKPIQKRWNPNLQRFEYRALEVTSVKTRHSIDGWDMLLRFFSEHEHRPLDEYSLAAPDTPLWSSGSCSDVRSYTLRGRSVLRTRWR